ncbi:MAG: hypothetical protein M3M85_02735 [bacterium]|nr:hypothetical protein [bacterium]
MGILEFREPKKGDVEEGGNVRAPGESEPGTPELAKKKTLGERTLTPGQFAASQEDEMLRGPALEFLRKFIKEIKLGGHIWPPGKILRNPDVLHELRLELDKKTKNFPWSLLPELLETLESENKPKIPIKKQE